jgi:hypothetical protein
MLPVGVAAGFLILSLALIVYCPYAQFLLVLVALPFVCIALLVLFLVANVRRRKRLQASATLALAAVIAVSFGVLKLQAPIRESLRWFLWSNRFKAELLALPPPRPGEIRHIEWEATGFAGVANDTTYVVFDPTDALYSAAQTGSPGKYNGIPCEVLKIRRLEAHWYSVRFYTDEVWGERNTLDCTGSAIPNGPRHRPSDEQRIDLLPEGAMENSPGQAQRSPG